MVQAAPDSRRIDRLGDFLVRRVIGEGGMGIVYEANERLSGRRVALKVLHGNLTRSEDARARFFSEMRITAELEHPNIVRSLSSAEIDGKLVMVLEYLEGRTLREELILSGALSVGRTLHVAKAIASALVAAHDRDPPVVHRDLKPENLMLLADGGVKVMDFGVAKVLSGSGGITRATQAVGTVQYMSPEQAEGRPVTAQTDLYALGLVIYEMLSGKVPFESPSLLGILKHHCETPPPPLPEELRRHVPAALERLVFDLLEKQADKRPHDARTVLAALEAVTPPVSATSATAAVETRPMRGKPPGMTEGRPVQSTKRSPQGPPKLDTIALLDRLEDKRGRDRVLWILGALVVAAAIAVPWVLFLRSRAAPAPKAKAAPTATATAPVIAAPPPVPTASAPDPCDGADNCSAFSAPNMASVDADFVIQEMTKFAISIDPNAKLGQASFSHAVSIGALDLTRQRVSVFTTFAIPTGYLVVHYQDGHFRGTKRSPASAQQALPAWTCTFKQAYDAATAAGFPFNVDTDVTLRTSLDVLVWIILTDTGHANVDARTCKVKIFKK